LLSQFADQLGPSTLGGLVVGGIYALVALGYTIVYGVLRLINFAHSEIFMMGSFTALYLLTLSGLTGPLTGFALVGMMLLLMAGAMVVSGGGAMLLEVLAYRPLRKHNAPRLAALISAIGASLFLQELFAELVVPALFHQDGRLQVPVPRLVDRDTVFTLFGVPVKTDQVVIVVAALVMMVALDQLVTRTRMGRGIRATAQDPEAAVLMGVNIDVIVSLTFALGGAMAGVAGVLYAMEFENVAYISGFVLGIKAFTAAVLGGIGNIRGALLGGFALGLVENWGAIFFGSQWKDVIAFVILVVVLLFRPTGILGESLQRARA
jgi:branched-chain amino acid transport system permease protein